MNRKKLLLLVLTLLCVTCLAFASCKLKLYSNTITGLEDITINCGEVPNPTVSATFGTPVLKIAKEVVDTSKEDLSYNPLGSDVLTVGTYYLKAEVAQGDKYELAVAYAKVTVVHQTYDEIEGKGTFREEEKDGQYHTWYEKTCACGATIKVNEKLDDKLVNAITGLNSSYSFVCGTAFDESKISATHGTVKVEIKDASGQVVTGALNHGEYTVTASVEDTFSYVGATATATITVNHQTFENCSGEATKHYADANSQYEYWETKKCACGEDVVSEHQKANKTVPTISGLSNVTDAVCGYVFNQTVTTNVGTVNVVITNASGEVVSGKLNCGTYKVVATVAAAGENENWQYISATATATITVNHQAFDVIQGNGIFREEEKDGQYHTWYTKTCACGATVIGNENLANKTANAITGLEESYSKVCGNTFSISGIGATYNSSNVAVVITKGGQSVDITSGVIKLTEGTYTVTATVAETVKYQSATKTATITVNHTAVTSANGTYNEENVDENSYNVWYTRTCECGATVASQKVKTEKLANAIDGLNSSYSFVCGTEFDASKISATHGTVGVEIKDASGKVVTGALNHGTYTVKATVASGTTYKSAEATATITVNHQAFAEIDGNGTFHEEEKDGKYHTWYTKTCVCKETIIGNEKLDDKLVNAITGLNDVTLSCGNTFSIKGISATYNSEKIAISVTKNNQKVEIGENGVISLTEGTYTVTATVEGTIQHTSATKTATITVNHQAFEDIQGNGTFHEDEKDGQYHTWYEKTCACQNKTVIGNEKFEAKLENAIIGLDDVTLSCGDTFNKSGITATNGTVSFVISDVDGNEVSGNLKHGEYTVTATVQATIRYQGATATAKITVNHQTFENCSGETVKHYENVDDNNYRYYETKSCACGEHEVISNDKTTPKQVTEIKNLADSTIVCGSEFDSSHVNTNNGTSVSVVVYDKDNVPVSGELYHGTYKVVATVQAAGENENWLYTSATKTVTLTVSHQAFNAIDGNGTFNEEEKDGQYHTWYTKSCVCGAEIIGNEKFEDKLANEITGLDDVTLYCGMAFDQSGISATHNGETVSVEIKDANGEVVSGKLMHGTYTVTAIVKETIRHTSATKTATITVNHTAVTSANGTYNEENVDENSYNVWYTRTCECGATVASQKVKTEKAANAISGLNSSYSYVCGNTFSISGIGATFNGEKVVVTITKGDQSVEITSGVITLSEGIYTVVASVASDTTHKSVEATATITVTHQAFANCTGTVTPHYADADSQYEHWETKKCACGEDIASDHKKVNKTVPTISGLSDVTDVVCGYVFNQTVTTNVGTVNVVITNASGEVVSGALNCGTYKVTATVAAADENENWQWTSQTATATITVRHQKFEEISGEGEFQSSLTDDKYTTWYKKTCACGKETFTGDYTYVTRGQSKVEGLSESYNLVCGNTFSISGISATVTVGGVTSTPDVVVEIATAVEGTDKEKLTYGEIGSDALTYGTYYVRATVAEANEYRGAVQYATITVRHQTFDEITNTVGTLKSETVTSGEHAGQYHTWYEKTCACGKVTLTDKDNYSDKQALTLSNWDNFTLNCKNNALDLSNVTPNVGTVSFAIATQQAGVENASLSYNEFTSGTTLTLGSYVLRATVTNTEDESFESELVTYVTVTVNHQTFESIDGDATEIYSETTDSSKYHYEKYKKCACNEIIYAVNEDRDRKSNAITGLNATTIVCKQEFSATIKATYGTIEIAVVDAGGAPVTHTFDKESGTLTIQNLTCGIYTVIATVQAAGDAENYLYVGAKKEITITVNHQAFDDSKEYVEHWQDAGDSYKYWKTQTCACGNKTDVKTAEITTKKSEPKIEGLSPATHTCTQNYSETVTASYGESGTPVAVSISVTKDGAEFKDFTFENGTLFINNLACGQYIVTATVAAAGENEHWLYKEATATVTITVRHQTFDECGSATTEDLVAKITGDENHYDSWQTRTCACSKSIESKHETKDRLTNAIHGFEQTIVCGGTYNVDAVKADHGTVTVEITNASGDVVANGTALMHGTYTVKASVEGTVTYFGATATTTITVNHQAFDACSGEATKHYENVDDNNYKYWETKKCACGDDVIGNKNDSVAKAVSTISGISNVTDAVCGYVFNQTVTTNHGNVTVVITDENKKEVSSSDKLNCGIYTVTATVAAAGESENWQWTSQTAMATITVSHQDYDKISGVGTFREGEKNGQYHTWYEKTCACGSTIIGNEKFEDKLGNAIDDLSDVPNAVCAKTFDVSDIKATAGTVTISVTKDDGSTVSYTFVEGKLTINDLSAGIYTVKATVAETIKYKGIEKSATITVNHQTFDAIEGDGTSHSELTADNKYHSWLEKSCTCGATVKKDIVTDTTRKNNEIIGLNNEYTLTCTQSFSTKSINATDGKVVFEIATAVEGTEKEKLSYAPLTEEGLSLGTYYIHVKTTGCMEYEDAEAYAKVVVKHQEFANCSGEATKHYADANTQYEYWETKKCACETDVESNHTKTNKSIPTINLVANTHAWSGETYTATVNASYGENNAVVVTISVTKDGAAFNDFTFQNGTLTIANITSGNYVITATVAAADATQNWLYTGQTTTETIAVEDKTVKVTIPTGDGYTVTGNATAQKTESYSFTVAIDSTYEAPNGLVVKVNGEPVTAVDGTYTVANVTGDITITVEGVVKKTVAVTLTAGEGYTLGGSSTVNMGENYSFTLTLGEYYEKGSNFAVKANGTAVTEADGKYIVKNVTSALTITVEGVVKKTFNVTLPSNPVGYTVNGATTVTACESYSFTVAIDSTYEAPNGLVVKVNGEPVTAVDGSYTVANVTGDITITVEGVTAKPVYNVTVPTGTGYTVTGAATVMKGESYSFTVALTEGYKKGASFAVTVNGEPVTATSDGTCTVENVTEALTIAVIGVEEIVFNAKLTVEGGFTDALAELPATSFLYSAESYAFTVTLTQHYTQSAISVYYKTADTEETALTAGENGTYTIENPHKDIEIIVKGVVLNTYKVTFYRNSVEKHTLDVYAKSVLTDDQLNAAKAAVINDGETFSAWVGDVTAPIVGNTAIYAYTVPTFGNAVTGNPVVGGEEVTGEYSAAGFEKIYKVTGAKTGIFAEIDLAKAEEVRFAFKLENSYLLFGNWQYYVDRANVWHEVVMKHNGAGNWTVTVTGFINHNYTENEESKSEVLSEFTAQYTGTTLSGILAGWYSDAVMFRITELRKTDIKEYDSVVSEVPAEGFEESIDKEAPADFVKVYYICGKETVKVDGQEKEQDKLLNKKFLGVDISGYSEVKFYFVMTNGFFTMQGYSVYAETYRCSTWVGVTLTNNGGTNWTITINGTLTKGDGSAHDVPYTYTATGTKLSEVLGSWFAIVDDNTAVYLTEIRGIKNETVVSDPVGEIIDDCVLTSGTTTDTIEEVPSGFTKIYKVNDIFNSGMLSTTDLSGYQTVTFAAKSTAYFHMQPWVVYVQESFNDWFIVTMENQGNGKWEVTVTGNIYDGTKVGTWTHTYELTSDQTQNLSTILSSWQSSHDAGKYTHTYFTELRGVKKTFFGNVISEAPASGFTESTEITAPDGFVKVYSLEGTELRNEVSTEKLLGKTFAGVNISGYSSVKFHFAIASGSFQINGENVCATSAITGTNWVAVTMTNDGANNWTIVVNGKLNGSDGDTYTYNVGGTNLRTILNTWFAGTVGDGTKVFLTEIRGIRNEEVVSDAPVGEIIEGGVLSNTTEDTVEEVPSGFEKVYKVNGTFSNECKSTADLSRYKTVKFALKSFSYFLLDNNWTLFLQENQGDWVYVTMTNNGDGTWDVKIVGDVWDGSQNEVCNPWTKNYTGTSIATILQPWYNGEHVYVTELRGEKIPLWGEEIEGSPVTGGTEVTGEDSAPGFEKVYKVTKAIEDAFAAIDLSRTEEVRFAFNIERGWVLFVRDWSVYADEHDVWFNVVMTHDGAGNWNVVVTGKKIIGATENRYEVKYTGTTLSEILSKWEFNYKEKNENGQEYSVGADFRITELRKTDFPLYGTVVSEVPAEGFTESTDKDAPADFVKVYYLGGKETVTVDEKEVEQDKLLNKKFAGVDISGYSEIKFYFMIANGYFAINGWPAYVQASDVQGNGDPIWVPVILTNNGNSWNITVYTKLTGGNVTDTTKHEYTSTGSTLQEVLKSWFSFADGTQVYLTEIRGIKNETEVVEPFGDIVGSVLKTGTTEDTIEEVPSGFEEITKINTKDNTKSLPFSDEYDVSEYAELRFAYKSSSWMLFNDWNQYLDESYRWVSVVMKQTEVGKWSVSVYSTKDTQTFTYEGTKLSEILKSWYNDVGNVNIYVTELRGVKKELATEETVEDHDATWGEQVSVSPVDASDCDETVPNGYEKVSVINTGDNKISLLFFDTDISAYSELRFAFKSEGWMLFGSWAAYIHAPNEWVSVVMEQTSSGNWTVTVYSTYKWKSGNGEEQDGSYSFTSTGTKLSDIIGSWYNDQGNKDFFFTDLRGVKKAESNLGTAKVSNLLFSELYTTGESVPDGFENVYQKYGLAADDFSDISVSAYESISFKIKLYGNLKVGETTITPTGDWISVTLNKGKSSWTVTVGEQSFANRTGTTLKEILSDWQADDGFTMLVTDVRGTWGSIKKTEIKAIAMFSSNKDDALMLTAAQRLATELKTHLGIQLLIEYHDDVTTLDPNKSYIVLGELATKLGITSDGINNATGFKIGVKNGHICVYGTTGNGIMNAVYGLLKEYLGLTYYTDTVYSISNTEPVFAPDEEIVANNYCFEYNWAIDGAITKTDDDSYNDDYMYRLGFSNPYSSIGGGWHNFTTIVSEEKYGASGTVSKNPNWFVERGTDTKFTTLNIANYSDDIAAAAANELAALINAADETRNIWSLSAPDYTDSTLTSNVYVTFMNKVAAGLNDKISRNIELMLLAYNSTFEAPTVDLVPTEKVSFSVMLAPVECNYYYDFKDESFTKGAHTNKWYGEQITAWGELTKKANASLYAWNYSAVFDNYFVPLDTITNMRARYRFYLEAGVTVIHDQGVSEKVAPDWAALKLYLKSEVAKNAYLSDEEFNTRISNFMNAYYGEAAAPFMKQLLEAQQKHYAETVAKNMKGGNVTQDSLFNKEYWSETTLNDWYGYIEKALNATTDETLRNRIQVEALTIRYLRQVLHTSLINKFSVYFVGATTRANDSLDQIIKDAKALGIERFAEGQGWISDDGNIFRDDNLVDGVIDNLK